MKIAICGVGLVGSCLYRMLSQAGLKNITLFERPSSPHSSCGINPCGWGTSAGIEELIESAALDPADYILQTFNYIVTNGVKVKAKAFIIDKPKLITDLRKGANILKSPVPVNEFDRIIDSSGYNRAFLPKINVDLTANCVQYRVSSEEHKELSIDISNLGYAWCFPISRNEYHIGAGSISVSPQRMLEELGWLKNSSSICACTGKVRLASPHFSLPFVNVINSGRCQVWGAGEAIGCVAPLAGEGIVPGLRNARILLDNWENQQAYEETILKEFSWMKEERKILDKAARGKRLGLFDAQVLINNTRRFKMKLNYKQSLSLLTSINRTL